MTTIRTIVIVGAGLAGATAAETLRAEGFDGRVVLIGEETVRPYERPPLSKDYLRGDKGFDDAAVHPAEFYEKHSIELRTSTVVTALDRAAATVTLDSGESLTYDRLLLATGAAPRRLSVPGAKLQGVHYLRNLGDADALRKAIQTEGPVVVIGGGWIGAEVVATARQLGADAAMVELTSVPLERVLGPEVGAIFSDLHTEHGVDLHSGVGVESLRGSGSVEEVRLTDGSSLPAGAVVVGIGATPRVELAESAGLTVQNGIFVDEYLATSDPHIYAAGDIANVFYPFYEDRLRLEHWAGALKQGPLAAKNMLGNSVAYAEIPFFYSDQYDLGMEYRGWAQAWDQVVFRGDPATREFIAFWLRDGIVLAAMNVNIWDVGDSIEALLRSQEPVDAAQLADAARPLL